MAYIDADTAEAALERATSQGAAAEANARPRYVDLVAVRPIYYSFDDGHAYVAHGSDMGQVIADVVDLLPHSRGGVASATLEIGDDDGPAEPVGTIYLPGQISPYDRGFIFEIDAPALVPREWRSTEWVERQIAGKVVTTTPVAAWFIRDAQRPADVPEQTFRERMMASPVREEKREGYVLPVMSLEESQAARTAALDLGPAAKTADDEPTSRTRFELLELNGRRRGVRANPSPDDRAAAVEKYEEFHRFKPKKIGDFGPGFSIPKVVYEGGKAKWVTYRSDKVDPSTLKKPKSPIDYIHEHDAGVVCYLAAQGLHATKKVAVPEEFRDIGALVRLGTNLGFCFVDADGEEIEAVSQAPMPELYSTPDGKCLFVVQSKRSVIAMEWGGALGVFARGIDG